MTFKFHGVGLTSHKISYGYHTSQSERKVFVGEGYSWRSRTGIKSDRNRAHNLHREVLSSFLYRRIPHPGCLVVTASHNARAIRRKGN